MRFWDSSAIVPLLVQEEASEDVEGVLRRDPEVVLWWGTPVECASALARVKRQEERQEKNQEAPAIEPAAFLRAHDLLDHLLERCYEVQPSDEVRARARRLLAVHPLRAADSLQLAAALLWCRERPRGVGFVCLDERLRLAATLEGFRVEPFAETVHDAPLPG